MYKAKGLVQLPLINTLHVFWGIYLVIYCHIGKIYIFDMFSKGSGPIMIKLFMHDPEDSGFYSCTN